MSDPTATIKLPKCRQKTDQQQLFDAPWPQPLDVVVLSGELRLVVERGLSLKPALVVARHDF